LLLGMLNVIVLLVAFTPEGSDAPPVVVQFVNV
jgi:hypothetical protein